MELDQKVDIKCLDHIAGYFRAVVDELGNIEGVPSDAVLMARASFVLCMQDLENVYKGKEVRNVEITEAD